MLLKEMQIYIFDMLLNVSKTKVLVFEGHEERTECKIFIRTSRQNRKVEIQNECEETSR